MKPKSILAFALLCAIWGSTWAAISILVQDVPPLRSAALRFLLAGGVLLSVVAIKRLPRPNWQQARALAVMSVTMIGLPYGLVFWAEQHVSSGMTAVLYAAMPLFTALLNPYIAPGPEKRDVPRAAVQAMIIGLGGILLVVSAAVSTSLAQALGAAAVLTAVLLNSGSTIYAKRALHDVSPITGTALQFLGAAMWLGMGSWMMERGQPVLWSRQAIGALLFLSIIGSVIAFTVYFWLLKQVEPYKLVTIQLIVPLVAVTEGALLLHEVLAWRMLAGAAIVLASVLMVMRVRPEDDELVTLTNEGG